MTAIMRIHQSRPCPSWAQDRWILYAPLAEGRGSPPILLPLLPPPLPSLPSFLPSQPAPLPPSISQTSQTTAALCHSRSSRHRTTHKSATKLGQRGG